MDPWKKRDIERDADPTKSLKNAKPVGRTKADEIMRATEQKIKNAKLGKICPTCLKNPCQKTEKCRVST